MQAITLTGTDLSLLPVALGIAGIGVAMSEEESKVLMDLFLQEGGSLIDTARIYSDWIPGELHRSERIFGDWMKERGNRESVLISTKGGHCAVEDQTPRLSPELLDEDLNGSLKSLQVDTIDLYWLHRDDINRSVGTIMDTLHAFQNEGRIRHYAASNWTPARIMEANDYAVSQGYAPFVASQVEWSLGSRYKKPGVNDTMFHFSHEYEELHKNTDISAVPFSSQAQGYFSKRTHDPNSVANSPFDTEGNRRLHDLLTKSILSLDLSMGQAILSYLWSQSFPVVPIIGCRTPAQLKESMQYVGRRLPDSLMASIQSKLVNSKN